MNSFLLGLSIVFFVAAWFSWRYYDLKKRLDHYADQICNHDRPLPTELKEIEKLPMQLPPSKRPSTFGFTLR